MRGRACFEEDCRFRHMKSFTCKGYDCFRWSAARLHKSSPGRWSTKHVFLMPNCRLMPAGLEPQLGLRLLAKSGELVLEGNGGVLQQQVVYNDARLSAHCVAGPFRRSAAEESLRSLRKRCIQLLHDFVAARATELNKSSDGVWCSPVPASRMCQFNVGLWDLRQVETL